MNVFLWWCMKALPPSKPEWVKIVIGPGCWCSILLFSPCPSRIRERERVRGSYRRERERSHKTTYHTSHITHSKRKNSRIVWIVCRRRGKEKEWPKRRCYPQLPKDVLLPPPLPLDLTIPCCFPTSAESSRFLPISSFHFTISQIYFSHHSKIQFALLSLPFILVS